MNIISDNSYHLQIIVGYFLRNKIKPACMLEDGAFICITLHSDKVPDRTNNILQHTVIHYPPESTFLLKTYTYVLCTPPKACN